MPKLKDPITIRDMEIKNRLAFAPMLSMSSDAKGNPTKRSYNLYEVKARGGIGMITFESVGVAPITFSGNTTANLGNDDNIPAYKKMADLIHQYGVKIGMQLNLPGLIGFALASVFNIYFEPVGPSKVDLVHATSAYDTMFPNFAENIRKNNYEIRELQVEEILAREDLFAAAAKRAITAGFDFVEIHSGHGTLHAAFLAPYQNIRTDQYGGSYENKCRFAIETKEKIRKAIGEKPPIFIRYSGDELLADGNKIKDGMEIAKIFENAGFDCLDVTQGNMIRSPFGIQIPTYIDHGGFIHIAEAIKSVVDIPVIGVGRIVDPKMADDFIQQGKADIIYMGRQLICDAETPNKYFNGQVDDIKYCLGCLQSCSEVCVYDAYSGQNYQELTPSTDLKKIIILGAGIAGMEAARVAKLRGHEVEIYEKSNRIGGLIPLLAKEYKKEDFMYIVNYLEAQLKKLDIPIHLDKELTRDELASLNADILVLATGTKATIPSGLNGKTNVLTVDEAISRTKSIGKNVVIWGLGAYWRGGPETAITLSEEGYNVKALIGQSPIVASALLMATGRRLWILEYLRDKKIPIYTKAKLLDVTENGIKLLDKNKNELFIEADTLIHCGSRITDAKRLKKKLEGVVPKIILIGDCKRPRDIKEAMKDAESFVRNLP